MDVGERMSVLKSQREVGTEGAQVAEGRENRQGNPRRRRERTSRGTEVAEEREREQAGVPKSQEEGDS